MKQDKAVYAYATWGVGVIFGLMAACAGGNTPSRTEEFENQIAVRYAGAEPLGVAAAGGGSGLGGSGTGGSGGASTGSGGSQASGSGGTTMAGSSGSGGAPAGMGGGSSSGCDGFAILQAKCGGGPCHGSQQSGSLSNFVLDETTAEAFADEPSSSCESRDNAPIFNPDNPPASLVIKKILATTDCGGRMPLGATTQQLTDAELTCVQDWISNL
jgi:hypothetical protein